MHAWQGRFYLWSKFKTLYRSQICLSCATIIDTPLIGYEYVLIQRILARELKFPSPIVGARKTNHGIIVRFSEELFQIFETMSWKERVEKQISRLPENTALDVIKKLTEVTTIKYNHNGCFPLYTLPPDACFVIRHTEVERLINLYKKRESHPISPSRMTTPLSRLFWLACKHNDTISPLLNHPYKLLSILNNGHQTMASGKNWTLKHWKMRWSVVRHLRHPYPANTIPICNGRQP